MVLSFFSALLLLNFSAAEDKHTEVKIQKIAEGVCQHFFYEKINGWGAVAYNGLIAVEEKMLTLSTRTVSKKIPKRLCNGLVRKVLPPKRASLRIFIRTPPQASPI